jgi:thermostable 8-oxoguanine DNA glycosylase
MIKTINSLPRINPKEITDLNRTKPQKEKFLLFCVLCAGKSSDVMAEKLEQLLDPVDSSGPRWELRATPLEYLVNLLRSGRLREVLEKHKIGKYDLLTKFVEKVKRNFDARIVRNLYPTAEWKREALVTIPGISYKTASLYRMHCFGDKIACLDTHVLRWLRTEGFKGVPKASPSNWDTYRHWENVFLGECYKRDVEPNHFDLDLWKQATTKSQSDRL